MKKIFIAGFGIIVLCALVLTLWLSQVLSDLPDVAVLKQYRPAAAAEVTDKDGNILTQCFDRKLRIWVPIASLPDVVIHAVVIAEDDTFFRHRGVNYKATWDAFVHDVQKRRLARGGSTITQQMIKNVLLSREKTITRKVREYILARRAEEILTKRQILQIYLNEVEWGDNIYGIEAASRFYFDRHASELSVAEAALLAGMLPNPRYFNPYKRPEKAKNRQERVLSNMLQARLITTQDYASGVESALDLRKEGPRTFFYPALEPAGMRPCYHYALEQVFLKLFGDRNVYQGGWTIKTSLDKNIQDTISRQEDLIPDRAALPAEITIVKQNDLIRAIVCSPGKADVGDVLVSPYDRGSDYDVSTVPLNSISQEQIVLSLEGVRPAAGRIGMKQECPAPEKPEPLGKALRNF